MAPTKLSVIMPNYNHAKYVAEALDAIVNQSFKPYEVIVCDDGSTDNSVEIIQQFVDRYPFVRLIKNGSNLGIFPSLDKLLSLVSGDYLYAAGADDKVLPGFFEKSMNLLSQYPQAGLCSALVFLNNESNNELKVARTPLVSKSECYIPPEKARLILQKLDAWIAGPTTIYKYEAFLGSGGFIPELRALTDGLPVRVIAARYGACFIPKPLAIWRISDNNYSSLPARCPAIAEGIADNYIKAMRNPVYSDIFPKGYIEDERKRFIYGFSISRLKFLEAKRLSELSLAFKGKPLLRASLIQTVKIDMLFRSLLKKIRLLITLRPDLYRMVRIKMYNFFVRYDSPEDLNER